MKPSKEGEKNDRKDPPKSGKYIVVIMFAVWGR